VAGDPIRQATLRSFEMGFLYKELLYITFNLFNLLLLLLILSGGLDVAVQETLEQLGVEFESRLDESDASDARRIISCVGVRVIAFVWSSDWTLTDSQQHAHNCMCILS